MAGCVDRYAGPPLLHCYSSQQIVVYLFGYSFFVRVRACFSDCQLPGACAAGGGGGGGYGSWVCLSVCSGSNTPFYNGYSSYNDTPYLMAMRIRYFVRVSLKMLCCKARAPPAFYGYHTESPFHLVKCTCALYSTTRCKQPFFAFVRRPVLSLC